MPKLRVHCFAMSLDGYGAEWRKGARARLVFATDVAPGGSLLAVSSGEQSKVAWTTRNVLTAAGSAQTVRIMHLQPGLVNG